MNTHSPCPNRPAKATRLFLATIVSGSVAAVLLSGCGSAPERSDRPVASSPSAGAVVAGVSASAGAVTSAVPPASPGAPETPIVGSPAPVGSSPSAVPVADMGPSLADIDRALADIDTQLNDADHDVATPEGDIR